MNTPSAVQSKIDCILLELPGFGSYQFADHAAEKLRVKAILGKMLELRLRPPQLSEFEEKIVAKALNVYEAYVDTAVQRKQAGEIVLRPLHTIASIQPELVTLETGQALWIKSVLKSRYTLTTPDDLILKLESVRDCDFRIRLEQGFTHSDWPDLRGMAHADQFQFLPEGYLRRDEAGVPRLYATSRSAIPLAVEMENIVRLEFANKNHGGELWRHPEYRPNDACFTCYAADDYMLRSRLVTRHTKNPWCYEVKLYDHGRLILHSENITIRQKKNALSNNENVLPASALTECLEQLLTRSPEQAAIPATTLTTAQLEWLASERAELLKLKVQQLRA